jgi:hypothetical protein
MRELLKNPKYQKVLFAASKITMEEMVASSNKKSKKKNKLKIGMIQVLQYILHRITTNMNSNGLTKSKNIYVASPILNK